MPKKTILDFQEMKKKGEKISWLVIYDNPEAKCAEKAGIDMILVGDSAAMSVAGHKSTKPITMDEMIFLAKGVRRGAPNTFLIGDMPLGSYQISKEEAIRNALRFEKEAETDAIKLEGGRRVKDKIEAIVEAGINVIGHIGLTPQSSGQVGGFKVQGKTAETAMLVIEDALAVEKAGAFALLVEAVPSEVTEIIGRMLKIPVLSIGAGPFCDGQLLLEIDLLGKDSDSVITPKFVKVFITDALWNLFQQGIRPFGENINFGDITREAFKAYIKAVKEKKFPDPEKHCYKMFEGELEKLREALSDTTTS